MPKVTANNITMNYDQQGTGEPLILIPYLGADHACYAFQMPEYAKHFTCISVDLRGAELAPGARLSLRTLFGGIDIKTPPGWRLDSSVKALAGGVDTGAPAQAHPEAPVLALEGLALMGGIAVGAKSDAA